LLGFYGKPRARPCCSFDESEGAPQADSRRSSRRVLAALADTAAAIAAYTVVPPGAELATIELKINYLSAVPGGKIKAEGKVLRAGRNFVVTECEVFDRERRLAAKHC